ncbi:GNAT family N-acetyltransferase [Erwinia sp. MMLR14_017]|uniref:GNAT family N-acetyltransferase n=1 Tax=Erwinia sp. MMLR14_017 TaxID=3093842 RepID=UPI00298FBACD|nr:GNAT family N-acetyltransferase [Erwinia sp. MMLR14_017]MDW8847987.1 GNAT family N-acetyltransferase [Erwinia sp. MMLR14_017]
MITVSPGAVTSEEAKKLLAMLSVILHQLTGSDGRASFNAEEVKHPRACFALARNSQGEAVGCGAIRPLDGQEEVAEMKRVFAAAGNQGVGYALLSFLEEEARKRGYREIWLETRKVNQRALNFYLKNGYQIRENFGRYVGREEAVCLGRML